MRCLYCGKQLALFKKLTGGGEFCSDAHKQSYHEEYNKLALSRLMEAQTRQEDRSAPKTVVEEAPPVAPKEPEMAEPKAWGAYLKPDLAARAPGGETTPACAAETPSPNDERPPAMPAPDAELHFTLELAFAGMVTANGPVARVTAPVAIAGDAQVLTPAPEVRYDFPHFEVDTAPKAPGVAGPVVYEVRAAMPGEAELQWESITGFAFAWSVPETIEPGWVDGLEFASAEQRLATELLGAAEETVAADEAAAAPADEVVEEVVEEAVEAAPEAEAEVASEAEVETEVEAEAEVVAEAEPEIGVEAEPEVVQSPLLKSVLTSDTPEPVIDDALLFSLFGRDEEVAASAPKPVVEAEPEVDAAKPVAEVQSAPAPEPVVARVVAPREPGAFLTVAIKPAGPPNKTKLMQSFQAIALVSSNPQIPVWNMLPLRPKMAVGRGAGPGAGTADRGKTEVTVAEARKPVGAAVEVANAPEPSDDLSVPTFGVATKPRAGIARWFKLGILVGVLGIASGVTGPAKAEAGTQQNMTTEFAVCRN